MTLSEYSVISRAVEHYGVNMRKKMGKLIRGGFYLLTISGSAEMANTIISEMPTKAEKHGIGRSLPLMKPE